MRTVLFSIVLTLGGASAYAQVFINEVFINPPGSADDTREFVELMGTPGMKLDGFAVALVNGTRTKYYPLGSIPPIPLDRPEIDEFFSLDGLALGANGILVIGIGTSSQYPTLLSDSAFAQWTGLWNGNVNDPPGNLQNDGANTLLLIRRRPGVTQADPTNPLGPIWGKDLAIPDAELVTPVIDPSDGQAKDQFGDGSLDKGDPNNMGGDTADLRGAATLDDPSDDLEVVDELSYEHDRGWEYDVDDRHVDLGSSSAGLPSRRVHAIGDPQGINPDALSRVDYRTKGPGWPPVTGATGEMGNGNNWQDTATEQWVRGESIVGSGGQGGNPQYFFDNNANSNPDSIQPYLTNVPLWLSDGAGTEYNFSTLHTYQIMAGRVNPLATPFIPGDVDRDGDCDLDDVAKIAAVFGDDDWVFSNSFAAAPQGDSGDPATQTRPWDVNATGDNGIECSDLQWTLNFQGNTDGRIVGRRYDSTTPSAVGVYLNPSTGVAVTLTAFAASQSGAPIHAVPTGDYVDFAVAAQVSSGANLAPGQQNGVMQFAHDLDISVGGVLRVVNVQPLGAFSTTRGSIQSLQGDAGDRGVRTVNGCTTSFVEGLTGTAHLYRVRLLAIGAGTASVSAHPATAPRLAASTPRGVKVGHTASNGDPATSVYPSAIAVTVVPPGSCDPCDTNCDGSVNGQDIGGFISALGGNPNPCSPCNSDTNGNGSVNGQDIQGFIDCLNQP